MADDLDVDLSDTYHPKWEDRHTNLDRAGSKILNSMLRDRYAGQRYRQASYDRLAQGQLSGEDAIRQNAVSAYGGMNPSGRTGALIAQQRASAPYGQADLAARQLARESSLQTINAGLAKNQAVANRYISLLGPYLNNKQIENNAALGLAKIEADLALAGAAGGSSGSSTLNAGIGAVGSIASAAILAGI